MMSSNQSQGFHGLQNIKEPYRKIEHSIQQMLRWTSGKMDVSPTNFLVKSKTCFDSSILKGSFY